MSEKKYFIGMNIIGKYRYNENKQYRCWNNLKQGDVVRCNILHKRKTLRMAIFNPIVTTFYSGKPDCTIITLKIKKLSLKSISA